MNIRDLRKYAEQTTVRLIVGGVLVLFVIGLGLIYFIYGAGPAMMGALCLLVGMAPIVLIFLALWLMEWVVKRANRE